jgi:hypothetical protein
MQSQGLPESTPMVNDHHRRHDHLHRHHHRDDDDCDVDDKDGYDEDRYGNNDYGGDGDPKPNATLQATPKAIHISPVRTNSNLQKFLMPKRSLKAPGFRKINRK